jgi:hypothetical protein
MSSPRLVKHQQSRVDGHHDGEVQLRHHTLRQFPDLSGRPDSSLRQKGFGFRAIEPRMNACDVIERLGNLYPARQYGDVGDEADVAHELIALGPGVAPEHAQLPLMGRQADDRVQRRGLAGAVGSNKAEDAAVLDL